MRVTLVLPLMLSGAAMAQSPGTFTATGNMTTARTSHTATLLNNGKVLIAGGALGGTASSATAELYDPAMGTFASTGGMTIARGGHTATLLPDGRVLVTGGFGHGLLAAAELYDPSTGTFAATGDMTTARQFHAATLLPNGKVLITGEVNAELYDSVTGRFSAIGNMIWNYYSPPTPALLPSGKVLIAEARVVINYVDGKSVAYGGAELYDPGTATFTPTGEMAQPDFSAYDRRTASLLPNGKVLVAGGDNMDSGSSLSAELYDPQTGTFTPTGDMTTARSQHTAILLPDGRVLMAGGGRFECTQITQCGFGTAASADIYDTSTGAFTVTGSMTTDRHSHTATLLPQGTVLVSGGYSRGGVSLISAEVYTPPSLQTAPVLFSLSQQSQGAILHATTHQLVSSSNPATVGEALEIYGTGLIDGSVIPPRVAIGGRMAEVLFFGKAPGFAGLNQVNVRMPSGVTPGPAVPVRLIYISRPSNEVTIGVE